MIKNKSFFASLFLLFAGVGCQHHYVDVAKVPLNHEMLASSFTGSPDPLQEAPLLGERLFIRWKLPKDKEVSKCEVELSILYKDLTEEVVHIPLKKSKGHLAYTIRGEKFNETKGTFAYRAVLKDEDGAILDTWQHRMWVNVIRRD